MTTKYSATAVSLMALFFASTAVASGYGGSSPQSPMPGFGGPGMSFPGSSGPWGAPSNPSQVGAPPASQRNKPSSYPKYAPPPPPQARESAPVPPATYGEQPGYAPPAGAYPPAQWHYPPAQWAYPPPRVPAGYPPSAAPYPVAPGAAPPDTEVSAQPPGAYPLPPGADGTSPGYPPQGQPPVDNRNEDSKGKGGFNPSNMMNKMPNPMNMFGGSKN